MNFLVVSIKKGSYCYNFHSWFRRKQFPSHYYEFQRVYIYTIPDEQK